MILWLRSTLFLGWFVSLTTVMSIIGLPLLLAPRRLVPPYARLWARLSLAGLRVLCGISWRVTGLETLPPRGPLLMAPLHQAQFDPLVWTLLRPDACFVLKRELTRIPLFGAYLRGAGMISVDRGGGAPALRGMLRDAVGATRAGRTLIIFPEGTRRPPGSPIILQPGIAALAARTGLPIVPVTTNSGLFWRPGSLDKHPGVIDIQVGAPIEAGLDRESLMRRLTAALQPVDNGVGEPGLTGT